MIVKNEEFFLENCLNAIKDLVDEIVIVDTGSTDKTIDIAKKFTDNIFSFTWADNFADARNESLNHATKDWVLVLDADEIIAKRDFDAIKSLTKKDGIVGFAFPQRNYTNNAARTDFIFNKDDTFAESSDFLGRVESWIVRLFKNNEKIRFSGAVHELVEPSIRKQGKKFELVRIPIHHFAENKNKNILIQKATFYHKLAKKKIAENPNDAEAHFQLGVQFKEKQDFSSAEESFTQSIKLDPRRISAMLNLAIVQHKQRKFDEAITSYRRALKKNKLLAEAYFGLGFCFFNKGDFDQAKANFEKAIENNPDFQDAYINLGAVNEKLGDIEEAKNNYEIALKINPKNARVYNNLGVAHEKSKDLQLAVKCYEEAVKLNYSKKEELKPRILHIKQFLEKINGNKR